MMSQRLSDYFALEAGEYLEQMDALLGREARPDIERLQRYVHGVRGSAQLANHPRIAGVAEALGAALRAVAAGRAEWSEDLRARVIRTLDDLRVLVRGVRSWGADEEARANAAVARWESLADPAAVRVPAGRDLSRLYPFVRQEIAGIVAQLGQVMPGMRSPASAAAPGGELLRRIRALRGIAGLDEVGAVVEILDGIEDAVRAVLDGGRPGEAAETDLLLAARDALLSLEPALDRGEAPGETDALRAYRGLRGPVGRRASGPDEEVVPIRSLFADDGGPHLVSSPVAPAADSERAAPGDVLEFLGIETAGFLDRAEAALAGSRDFEPAEVASLVAALGDMAATYGLGSVVRITSDAVARLRAAESREEARSIVAELRRTVPEGLTALPEPVEEEALAAVPGPAGDAVGIETLLLRGPAALLAALRLRPDLERLVEEQAADLIRERLSELFDLLELALPDREPR
jgi:hypothetical protein